MTEDDKRIERARTLVDEAVKELTPIVAQKIDSNPQYTASFLRKLHAVYQDLINSRDRLEDE